MFPVGVYARTLAIACPKSGLGILLARCDAEWLEYQTLKRSEKIMLEAQPQQRLCAKRHSDVAQLRVAIRIAVLLGAFVFAQSVVIADTYMATPSNYLGLLRKLRAGDTLRLAPGEYANGLPIHGLLGEQGRPIVIKGPESGAPARFIARPRAHTVSIVDSAWVEIHNLELEGNGQPVAAVRCEGHANWAHHITLDSLLIKGHGANQGIVGIATFCPAWGWVIRNNTIVGAGTGMYLGQSDGSAPFVAGVIERNLVVDSIGYNVQIKHQLPRPPVEGMPEQPGVTIIRHNVFSKSANSAAGNLARPNLLVGHWPVSGPGADDIYAIYGNFFYQNPTEALFQGEGNLAFYSNVLVNTHGHAVHVQPHNDVPRRVEIFRNTVIAAGNGIRVQGGHPEYTQRVAGNAVFSGMAIAGGEQLANLARQYSDAAEHLAEPYQPLGQLDLSPKPGKLDVSAYRLPLQAPLPDLDRDFDGRIYEHPMAGAYARNQVIWPLRLTRKR